MLNSSEHEITIAYKTKILTKKFLALSHLNVVFIMLIMPTIAGILIFMSRLNFVLS